MFRDAAQLTLHDQPGWKASERRRDKVSPAAPDLSHYYGRAVTDIVPGTGVDGDPVWSLVLEGDVIVQNYDETLPIPGDHIKGQRFSNTTLYPKVTSMFFGGLGGNTVSLNPMKYAIADKSVMDEPYYPQVSEAQGTWQPPPASDERVAEGPDEDWIAAQEQTDAGS